VTWTTLVGVSPLVVRYVDPYALEGAELHPICVAILDRWWATRAK
jgi:hypothetical protein